MKTARENPELPRVATGFVQVFAAYSRWYLRRNFHSVRLLKKGLPPRDDARPMVVYLNHAAWWDPLVCLLLAREFFPSRTSFAPINAAMLARYGFFRRLGFFGIEPGPRGARAFLRTARAALDSPRRALWLTPQGTFVDTRERPLKLRDGLGALAMREPETLFVPLAIEYTFWTEPRAEILVAFGEPILPCAELFSTTADWTQKFSAALESTQDELAARSCRRAEGDWQRLARGKSGVGAVYDGWRWLRARVRGEKFSPEHRAEVAR